VKMYLEQCGVDIEDMTTSSLNNRELFVKPYND
jgi:hypothetical protein